MGRCLVLMTIGCHAGSPQAPPSTLFQRLIVFGAPEPISCSRALHNSLHRTPQWTGRI